MLAAALLSALSTCLLCAFIFLCFCSLSISGSGPSNSNSDFHSLSIFLSVPVSLSILVVVCLPCVLTNIPRRRPCPTNLPRSPARPRRLRPPQTDRRLFFPTTADRQRPSPRYSPSPTCSGTVCRIDSIAAPSPKQPTLTISRRCLHTPAARQGVVKGARMAASCLARPPAGCHNLSPVGTMLSHARATALAATCNPHKVVPIATVAGVRPRALGDA